MARKGFTLLEIIIVAASFAVIFLVATTVYTNAFRQQRKVESTQRVSSDTRYLMETMARAIRINGIRYNWYQTLANKSQVNADITQGGVKYLALESATGVRTCFALDILVHKIKLVNDCPDIPAVANDFFQAAIDITPQDVVVDELTFYVFPRSDPFTTGVSPVPCDFINTSNPLSGKNSQCQADQWCCPTDTSLCDPYLQGASNPPGNGICINPNLQPSVTIFLKTHATTRGDNTPSSLQTTVVSRVYKR